MLPKQIQSVKTKTGIYFPISGLEGNLYQTQYKQKLKTTVATQDKEYSLYPNLTPPPKIRKVAKLTTITFNSQKQTETQH